MNSVPILVVWTAKVLIVKIYVVVIITSWALLSQGIVDFAVGDLVGGTLSSVPVFVVGAAIIVS